MSKEENKNPKNESEIENRIVTVGSNRGYRALMVVVLFILASVGIYYLYFFKSSSNNDETIVVVEKQEEIEENIQELKEKLEQVPDDTLIHERIITDLPPLPPISTPEVIPKVNGHYMEKVISEESEMKETSISDIPVLAKRDSVINRGVIESLPTSFPKINANGYPRDRRNAQMLTISGSSKSEKTTETILSRTSAQPDIATKVGKLGFMITQGKIIDAVLETAINSNLEGMLRAIVSSNVYAETGDKVLIPRGSRLIGSYLFDSNIARARVDINWNRIILPHGIDIAISSPSTDELGRAGVVGTINNKIVSALFSSILLAGVSIGSAILGQKASNYVDSLTLMDTVKSFTVSTIDFYSLKDTISLERDIPSDVWKLGLGAISRMKNAENEQDLLRIIREEIAKTLGIEKSKVNIDLENIKHILQQLTRKNRSLYEKVVSKSIDDFSKDIRDMVERSTDKKPTIYINQGTTLKVVVNKDIIFPSQAILNQ